MLDPHVDPFEAFAAWYADACRSESDVPNAMALATVDPDGAPSVRVVLMKALSVGEGLQFFTNLGSRKATNLAVTARASAVFHWKSLERQVIVEGPVSRVPDEVADAYWATRPRASQLGAWASKQGRVLDVRATLETRLDQEFERFRDVPVPRPPFWSGFRVDPTRFEFWQGRPDRLHERTEFRLQDGAWTRGMLFP